MKTTNTIEIEICDFCKTNEAWDVCHGCGKCVCYECAKTQGITYHAYVFMSGHGDTFYCHSCDAAATSDKVIAFRRIRALRAEHDRFHHDLRSRQEQAEAAIKKFL